jgi:hypothetical protein
MDITGLSRYALSPGSYSVGLTKNETRKLNVESDKTLLDINFIMQTKQ